MRGVAYLLGAGETPALDEATSTPAGPLPWGAEAILLPSYEEVKAGNLWGIHEGGRTILYHEEYPFIRRHYQQRLSDEGVEFTMPEEVFKQPAAVAS